MILTRIAQAHADALWRDEATTRALIVGSAGSGKTRLVRQLRDQLVRRGRTVVDAASAPEIERTPREHVLLVDDAHVADADILAAVAERLRDPRASVVLTTRPWPQSAALQQVSEEIERARPAIVLGNVSGADVTAHLIETGRRISHRCVDGILDLTGHLTWLVSEALAVHDDVRCSGDPEHPEIAEGLRELIAHRLDTLDAELRGAIESFSFAAHLGGDAHRADELALAGYAKGLLLRGGRPAPIVRDTVRATVPLERLVELYAAAAQDGTDSAASELIGRVRDPRIAAALLQDGDRALGIEPARAAELYRGAGEAGADPGLVALRRAEAAWALGEIDGAGAFIDALDIDPADPGSDTAIGIVGAVWAARGDMRMSSTTFRLAQPRTPEAVAHATIAAVAAGDDGALADLGSVVTPRALPTALVVALEHLVRGLRSSLTSRSRTCLGDLVRATEMYTASTSAAPTPEVPAVVAALAAIHLGELATAQTVLDTALREGHGGAWAQDHLLLWRAWVAVQRERPQEAEVALARATSSRQPLTPRDALLADAIRVALVRRYSDTASLAPAWSRARESILRAQFDLFSLIPLGEFVVTAARMGDLDGMRPHLDEAMALVGRIGTPPLWSAPLHWAALHASILANRPDELAPHARALVAAAPHSPLAAVMAHAGRVWTEVLTGTVDVDAVEHAASGLAGVGLAWDGARLAGHGASRSDDRRVIARLLACARQLHPRPKSPAPATVDEAPTPEPASGGNDVLSIREREVALLVLQGKTYAEIGESIFISPRTAEHHIARIRRRLGATSRSDLIAKLRLVIDEDAEADQRFRDPRQETA